MGRDERRERRINERLQQKRLKQEEKAQKKKDLEELFSKATEPLEFVSMKTDSMLGSGRVYEYNSMAEAVKNRSGCIAQKQLLVFMSSKKVGQLEAVCGYVTRINLEPITREMRVWAVIIGPLAENSDNINQDFGLMPTGEGKQQVIQGHVWVTNYFLAGFGLEPLTTFQEKPLKEGETIYIPDSAK